MLLTHRTATFVFTDIEGSTQLLRMLGDDDAAVMKDHHELVDRHFVAVGGGRLATEGDGGFFVSDDADSGRSPS